jgi:hypothetical protein
MAAQTPTRARPGSVGRAGNEIHVHWAGHGIIAGVPGGLLYRLFGAGKMPAAIRAEFAGERVLFETEGIRAVQTFSGHVPGLTSSGSKQLSMGAFAVTDRRVVGTTRAGKAVDVAYVMQADGPATLTLEPDGLHVVWDMDRVHPACRGTMKLHFKDAIPDADLAQFPVKKITFQVDPAKVVRFTGSRKKLPTDD